MNYQLSKRFEKEVDKIADYICDTFGEKYAMDFVDEIQSQIVYIAKYPEASAPESLLKGKQIQYRSKIVSTHNKAIYYIKGDTVYFVDLWDMRRHPDNLSKRIKTK